MGAGGPRTPARQSQGILGGLDEIGGSGELGSLVIHARAKCARREGIRSARRGSPTAARRLALRIGARPGALGRGPAFAGGDQGEGPTLVLRLRSRSANVKDWPRATGPLGARREDILNA